MSSGFNLIGYATSPMGLGEDLRSFAVMLDHLDIPYSVIDIPTDSSGLVNHTWKKLTQEDYPNSFFFMSPMECARLAEAQPALFSTPKTKLGYFLWELPDFPIQHVPALKLVDHIWCPTKFVQQAFFDKVQKLTLAIPLPVIKPVSAERDFRKDLGIPINAFVALYLFDIRSTEQRKNPEASIRAFIEFAANHPDAYLILKINRSRTSDQKRLMGLAQHPRIRLVTELLTNNELASLYDAANCYLSLHRSEGFGRTLVEALQHGLDLICTNYSGPADFLTPENALLVDWKKCQVNPGDYPYTDGSNWSEPDINSAIRQLEVSYARRKQGKNLAASRTGNLFQPKNLADKYRPLLMSYLK